MTAFGLFIIQSSSVQSQLAKLVTEKILERDIEGSISLGKVHVLPFSTVIVRDFLLKDSNPRPEAVSDTILYTKYISVRLAPGFLRSLGSEDSDTPKVKISKVKISDGEFNLVLEGTGMTNLQRALSLSVREKDPDATGANLFTVGSMKVDNMVFTMHNLPARLRGVKMPNGDAIDYLDMHLEKIHAKGEDISFDNMICRVKNAKVGGRDSKSGYTLKEVRAGSLRVGRGLADINEIDIWDDFSRTRVEYYRMYFKDARDFIDYNDKVRMELLSIDTRLNARTLGYLGMGFTFEDIDIIFDGLCEGTVRDLYIDSDFTFCSRRDKNKEILKTHLKGRGMNLHRPTEISFDATASFRKLSTAAIDDVLGKRLTSGYAKGCVWDIDMNAKGAVDGIIDASILAAEKGREFLRADLRLGNILDLDDMSAAISLIADRINLKKILGNDNFGEAKILLDASGKLDNMMVDNLTFENIDLKGYRYHDITISGHLLQKGIFDGSIRIDDPCLMLDFEGRAGVDTHSEKGRIADRLVGDFTLGCHGFDLSTTALDPRGGKSFISFNAEVNKTQREDPNQWDATIDVQDLVLESDMRSKEDSTSHHIMVAASSYEDGNIAMNIDSDFISAIFKGDIEKIGSDLKYCVLGRHVTLPNAPDACPGCNPAELKAEFKESAPLLDFIFPGLYIENGSTLNATLGGHGRLKATASSERLAYGLNMLQDVHLKVSSDSLAARAILTSSLAGIGGDFMLEKDTLRLETLGKDRLSASLRIGQKDNSARHGDISLEAALLGDKALIRLNPGDIYLQGRHFSISPCSAEIGEGHVDLGEFRILSDEDEEILASGNSAETIKLLASGVQLETAKAVVEDFPLSGRLDGFAFYRPESGGKGGISLLDAEFTLENAAISGASAGNFSLGASWDSHESPLAIKLYNNSVNAQASYNFEEEDFNLSLGLDNFDISLLEHFTKSLAKDVEGTVSGHADVSIDRDGTIFLGEDSRLNIDEMSFSLVPTGVSYTSSASLKASSAHEVEISSLSIHDFRGKGGSLNGSFSLTNLEDAFISLAGQISDLQVLDLPSAGNVGIWGTLFTDCDLSLSGPLTDLRLSANVGVSSPSTLEANINAGASNQSTGILTFSKPVETKRRDAYREMLSRLGAMQKKEGALSADVSIMATDELEAKVSLGNSGNVLARGTGDIHLVINSRNPGVTLGGQYTVSSGKCRFEAVPGAGRDFTIREGSLVRLATPIENSELNLSAIFTTKASVSTLISDVSGVAVYRNVDCIVEVSDRLSNPSIALDIEVPNLDPTIQSQVEAALNTDDKKQKQFVSLLVSGNFIPSEEGGIVNNSSLVYSNVAEILASQFSNILHKFDIPIDLGLNYQPNQNGGRDLFDVAFTTQLFNNRIEIEGNVSNGQQYGGVAIVDGSDLMGDFDVNFKVDRKGQFRLKGFSHSADKYTNYLDNSQRNGIGISFQKDFNSFGDLIREIFTPRRKKEESPVSEAPVEMKSISVL